MHKYFKNLFFIFGVISISGFVFSQDSRECANIEECIQGRWHLVGYEDNVMYQFEDNYRYSLYSIDGTFGSLEDAGGTPNPYTLDQSVITLDLFFGNIVTYQMSFICGEEVVEFKHIENGTIHSTLFREGYNYNDNNCEDFCRELSQNECSESEECEWMIEIDVEDGIVQYYEYCGDISLENCYSLNEEECSDTLDCTWNDWDFCEIVEYEQCDPDLVCLQVLTCCDGRLYPTSCCENNCDESLGECEDSNNEDCEDGDFNNENPCNPMECWDGQWIEIIIDCAEQMGVPCEGGEYVPPADGECCSVCIENDCDSDLACGEAISCCDGVLYPTTCCERNCDEPIGECEDPNNGECEDGEMNVEDPCMPMECYNGEWSIIIIDCAEQMGFPCEGGYYIPPEEGECCSTCVEYTNGDINGDQLVNVVDIVMLVNMILESDFNASGDVNGDGQLNVVDVVSLVNIVLDLARKSDSDSMNKALLNGSVLDINGNIGGVQADGILLSKLEGNDLMMFSSDRVVIFNLKGKLETKSFSFSSVPNNLVIATSDEKEIPLSSSVPSFFTLNKAYPNPFNPSTYISYSIQKPAYINLSVFNVAGKKVEDLISSNHSIGDYSISWNAKQIPSGVYFVKLSANNQNLTQKIILIK